MSIGSVYGTPDQSEIERLENIVTVNEKDR